MAPIAVRTYKAKDKKKRPWANIQNVLSELKNKEKTESITVFEALFAKNIKGFKSKRTGKYCRNENNNHAKQLPYKRTVETKLDIINVTSSVQDTFLDSTFDRILVGPMFQQPRPIDMSHKSKEFSTSSFSTYGNQCDTRSSASDPSYVDDTLFPVTWKTRKKLGVLKSRKILKRVPKKPDPPLQFRKRKKTALDMNPCITSTPNGNSCREKNRTSPFLSPILHCVQKGQKREVINDITEDKNNSVYGSTSLSKSHVCILDSRKGILPEIHQFDPSFKDSNVSNELLPSSVVEESASKSLCKFAGNKVESCHVSAGAVLSDSVIVIECASSQLQSCQPDEKIVSAIASSYELYGTDCELRKSKESFMCKDQKSDAAKQSYMTDSTSAVSVSGPCLSLPVHHCADMNLRKQKNRWTKCEGRSSCRSDDSSAEELLGFSDVPLELDLCEDPITGGFLDLSNASVEQDSCEDAITRGLLGLSVVPIEQDLCEDPITEVLPPNLHIFSGDNNKCAESNGVTEGVNITANLPSSYGLYGTDCELRKSKESFMCKDQKSDAAKQSYMTNSTGAVSVSEPCLSLPVHHCADMNLRKQKNRWTKCEGRSSCRSDDSSAEELLGFSDVPLELDLCEDPITGGFLDLSNASVEQDSCEDAITRGLLGLSDVPIEQDLCEDPITEVLPPNLHIFSGDNNKCAESNGVTEGVNITANLPSSKSGNVSIVLFDSWDSGNGTKLETTIERGSENGDAVAFDQIQVSESGVQNNHSENSCTEVSKHRRLHESSVDIDGLGCKYPRDETELLCNNISEEHLFQEPSDIIIDTGKFSIPAKTESTIMPVKMGKSLRRQSSRRLSHQVVPSHRISGPQGKLLRFHVYHNSTCQPASRDLSVALPEEVEKFELLGIAERPLVSAFSARDAVLQRCCQRAPISFSEAFPTSYWLKCRKIGEGVYGEVFLSEGQEKSVLKVIPIEGEVVVNGEPQKKFEEILSEIVIAMELSGLRNGTENRTGSFPEVKRCLCVQGAYPEKLIDLWDDYDNDKGSENDSPTMFVEDQLYIILVLTHGGYDLEAHFFTNAEQSHSILIQTGYALAVAEQVLEFEHRDLHWGNVLVSQTTEKNATFKLCGKEYTVPTKGVQVTIIDFTLSRMTYDGCCIYNDLSKDPALFTAEGDYQFEVYRLMQKHTMNSWHHFNPYTNLLWLHYLLDKMCTMVNYLHVSSKSHKQGLKKLMKLQDIVLKHKSTQEFILNEFV